MRIQRHIAELDGFVRTALQELDSFPPLFSQQQKEKGAKQIVNRLATRLERFSSRIAAERTRLREAGSLALSPLLSILGSMRPADISDSNRNQVVLGLETLKLLEFDATLTSLRFFSSKIAGTPSTTPKYTKERDRAVSELDGLISLLSSMQGDWQEATDLLRKLSNSLQ